MTVSTQPATTTDETTFSAIYAAAERGIRTPEYEQTLMRLCLMLASAITDGDQYRQQDVQHLIRTLTERGNYREWLR